MEVNDISFENLPRAVAHLVSEIAEIKFLVERKEPPIISQKRIPLDITEACQIIGKAKPTVYTLVRKRLIPCYKNGKKLYFFEDELLDWISQGKKKTLKEIEAEAKLDFGKNFKKISTNFNKN
ncbi:helix-turn-helix domain-containing protein [Kaistella jeonii]|uniref:Excisionase n=1 Tax=Kaistella jeonii TaxID=266749 RepID=A0A0C1D6W6_9FLAO|nr:helix-turn-helix domain-containing protein [Kaistella jeonii]KIA89610.1 excisionase [Kaistella jeonii]SFB89984.1 DNA binding domain-containing protein, excisionase family [Kaistella jeonii]VEI95821.1 Helix-turn-helix domain [Kaistella jeonii]